MEFKSQKGGSSSMVKPPLPTRAMSYRNQSLGMKIEPRKFKMKNEQYKEPPVILLSRGSSACSDSPNNPFKEADENYDIRQPGNTDLKNYMVDIIEEDKNDPYNVFEQNME